MSDEKKKVTLLKMPSFTRLLIGGLVAYWLSTIMNPAFVAIAVLVVLLIPVLTVDNIFSRQFNDAYRQPAPITPKVMKKSEYLAAIETPAEKQPETESKIENKLKAAKGKDKAHKTKGGR